MRTHVVHGIIVELTGFRRGIGGLIDIVSSDLKQGRIKALFGRG